MVIKVKEKVPAIGTEVGFEPQLKYVIRVSRHRARHTVLFSCVAWYVCQSVSWCFDNAWCDPWHSSISGIHPLVGIVCLVSHGVELVLAGVVHLCPTMIFDNAHISRAFSAKPQGQHAVTARSLCIAPLSLIIQECL